MKIARAVEHYKREKAQQIDLHEMWLWLIMEESLFGARTLCLPCEAAGPSVTHMLNILPLSWQLLRQHASPALARWHRADHLYGEACD